jgi:glucosamine 6-phosphate synthetase-like amidotransferase/phosphosugar isomerase protein
VRRRRARTRRTAPRAQRRARRRSRRAGPRSPSRRHTGIAHTRWATHGAPVTQNAHPIFSSNALALVHNGIIENFETLRDALRAKGYEFVSQTDTEVIAHLMHSLYRGDLFDAVREAVQRCTAPTRSRSRTGSAAHRRRRAPGSPLVVGHGDGENFLASDALALAGSTDRFVPRRRRRLRTVARRREDRRSPRRARRARDARGQRVRRRGRARPLSPLHAEGNLRAAARVSDTVPQPKRSSRRCSARRQAPRSRTSTAC